MPICKWRANDANPANVIRVIGIALVNWHYIHMRKRNKGRILSRPKNQRKALLKSLATGLFLHSKIKTTEAKAKELRVVAEQFITRAKVNSLANRRVLAQVLSAQITKKLVDEIAPQYLTRQGGYTRIIKMGPRRSDGASMVIIELVK